jgi:subtilisin family serine protease
MGWTGNHNRRNARRRHRPLLESLDDRCLLSTSAGVKLADHLASHAINRRHAAVRHAHEGASQGEKAGQQMGHHGAKLRELERPAGAIETGATTAYDPIIGASQVRSNYNVQGTGMSVAVIDTGVDFNNPALGGGFGPNNKVIAGFDFADNTANPIATASQHGTSIAGLIGSDDPNDLGVAPGVNIVALRVTDSSNTASLTSIANALQWVINNHSQYNITSINMSLSDGGNYAQNWFANDNGDGERITSLIGQLSAMNIPVIAATGNSFSGQQGEGFAAIVAGTISVTATDLSGNLLSSAQRLGSAIGGASATTIAAPGEGLTAPSGDSGTATVEGTSFATALVTGGVTLLQDIYESRFGSLPTVDQIKSWIQQSATPVHDPVTGITVGELNLTAAAALIPPASRAPTSPPPVATVPSIPSSPGVTTTTTTTTVVAPPVSTTAITTAQTATSSPTTTTSPSTATTTAPSSTTAVTTAQTATSSPTTTTSSSTATATAPSSTTAVTTAQTATSSPATTTSSSTATATAPSTPADSTTTAVTTTSSVQVYINGQSVGSGGGSTLSNATTTIDQSTVGALLSSASGGAAGSSAATAHGTSQLQIWKA